MTKDERIAALREALETIRIECNIGAHVANVLSEALDADNAAAAEPLPDLPLAAGSSWRQKCGNLAVIDADGDTVAIDGCDGLALLVLYDHEGAHRASARLLDVLALARRAGVV
jgi:hypothetical protein